MLVKLVEALYNDIGSGLNDATIRSRLDSIREQAEAVETEIQQAQARIKELETKLQAQKLDPHQDRLETAEKMLQLVFRSQTTAASLQHMASTLGLSKQIAQYHAECLEDRKLIALHGDVCQITRKGRAYSVENNLA
jgi:predicted  nucleic acid-binding Zn-ribbon protein